MASIVKGYIAEVATPIIRIPTNHRLVDGNEIRIIPDIEIVVTLIILNLSSIIDLE